MILLAFQFLLTLYAGCFLSISTGKRYGNATLATSTLRYRAAGLLQRSPIFHLVPHSHCDAAYKKTFDEYYETEVRNVLDSILIALPQDASRRFVWSETSYLIRWWKDPRTTPKQRNLFRELVFHGQIEIVNGGFVMHDEKITRYESQIQQMTEGHDRLKQILIDSEHRPNISVSTGWQIDPFGPSPFSVNLHDWAGIDFLVLNRMPLDVKESLRKNKTLQFYWETNHSEAARILVHVMDTHYASPDGFNWEDLEHGAPIPVTKANVRERSKTFMNILLQRAKYYRTQHVMIPMGGDFTYQNASMQFENIDRIMEHVATRSDQYSGATLRYSTPNEYKRAVLSSFSMANLSIPTIDTGVELSPLLGGYYFQSPNLKQMLRTCEIVLKAVEVRLFRTFWKDTSWDSLSRAIEEAKGARETISLMQHHDAITATSYRFVIADYARRLILSYNGMASLLDSFVNEDLESSKFSLHLTSTIEGSKLIGGGAYLHETVLVRDAQSARSIHFQKILDLQMGMGATGLVVFNSLARGVETVVHFVCSRDDIAINLVLENGEVKPIESQATPLEAELEVSNLGLFLISFTASVPPLDEAHFQVQVCDLTWNTFQEPQKIPSLVCSYGAESIDEAILTSIGLEGSKIRVGFDRETLDLVSMTTQLSEKESISSELVHDFMLYYGGNDTVYEFATGVGSSNPPPLFGNHPRRLISAYRGIFFSQVILEFTPWLRVRYRVLNTTRVDTQDLLQVSVFVGPLPPSVDLASRLETKWSNTSWFVEESGFIPVEVSFNSSKGVGDGNTRPLVSRTWIENHAKRLTIFSVDPRGVVSKQSGQVDVFWHRRNQFTPDWWKQGDDRSSTLSSIWIKLDRSVEEDSITGRQLSTILSNDLVMLATERLPNRKAVPSITPFPALLYAPTLRVSQADRELDSGREEAWMDLQVENLSERTSEKLDLASLLDGSRGILLQAADLNSLTYLISNTQKQEKHSFSQISFRTGNPFGGCSLETVNGGGKWILTVEPRMICSIRIPILPLIFKERNGHIGI